jgi:hypothetical protein
MPANASTSYGVRLHARLHTQISPVCLHFSLCVMLADKRSEITDCLNQGVYTIQLGFPTFWDSILCNGLNLSLQRFNAGILLPFNGVWTSFVSLTKCRVSIARITWFAKLCLLGYNAVYSGGSELTFPRKCHCFLTTPCLFLTWLVLRYWKLGDIFLRNVRWLSANCMVLYGNRQNYSQTPLLESRILDKVFWRDCLGCFATMLRG